jgi:hypothetical protein
MKGGETYASCAAGSLVPRRVPHSAEVAVAAAMSTCVSLGYPMVRLLCVSADPAGRAPRCGEGRRAENREEDQRKIYHYAECCVFAEDVGCGEHPLVISLGPRRMRVG